MLINIIKKNKEDQILVTESLVIFHFFCKVVAKSKISMRLPVKIIVRNHCHAELVTSSYAPAKL
jgi:hypothetical protein